jgi:hypothetical protein
MRPLQPSQRPLEKRNGDAERIGYLRDLHEEITARDSWQRLAVELSREVESMQARPVALVVAKAAGE